MPTSKPNTNIVDALAPRAVAAYLESRGWKRSRNYGEYGAIFSRTTDAKADELLISTSREARDYAAVMSLLVSDLAEAEQRPPHEVVADLTLAPYDVIRVRSLDADDIGSVPLSAGVDLHEQARALIVAAANKAAAPEARPCWPGRPFDKVDAYLQALRLGQSQRGSFVLSLLSPWDFVLKSEAQQQSLFPERPFGRKVTLSLAQALASTRHAIDRSVNQGIPEAFGQAVADGVSANLCDALAALARDGEGIEVSVNWSLTKPEQLQGFLRVRREDAQTLSEASQALVQDQPVPDAMIEGLILQLNNDISTFDGSVVIRALINGSLRNVKVSFEERDRKKVFGAGQDKLGISVVGDLVAKGRHLDLLNPRDLTIISSTDD